MMIQKRKWTSLREYEAEERFAMTFVTRRERSFRSAKDALQNEEGEAKRTSFAAGYAATDAAPAAGAGCDG
jgi:hypothetical protein